MHIKTIETKIVLKFSYVWPKPTQSESSMQAGYFNEVARKQSLINQNKMKNKFFFIFTLFLTLQHLQDEFLRQLRNCRNIFFLFRVEVRQQTKEKIFDSHTMRRAQFYNLNNKLESLSPFFEFHFCMSLHYCVKSSLFWMFIFIFFYLFVSVCILSLHLYSNFRSYFNASFVFIQFFYIWVHLNSIYLHFYVKHSFR